MDHILYFYGAGTVTTVCGVLVLILYKRIKKLSRKYEILRSEYFELSQKITAQKDVLADYISTNWHMRGELNNKFSVLYNLKLVGTDRNNPNLHKFEVINAKRIGKHDPSWYSHFVQKFYEKNGGWLDVSKLGDNFRWIEKQTVQEKRDDKIKSLLD